MGERLERVGADPSVSCADSSPFTRGALETGETLPPQGRGTGETLPPQAVPLPSHEGRQEVPQTDGELAIAIREIVGPVMAQVADILRRNNEAMERLAAQQQVMTARIADLEKQVRLKTPLSKSQEKCVNDAIRARARELMEGKGYGSDGKAVTKIAAAIRKSVLARYGVGSLREAPAYDYEVCMESAKRWCDLVVIRDVVKEARARAEESEEG